MAATTVLLARPVSQIRRRRFAMNIPCRGCTELGKRVVSVSNRTGPPGRADSALHEPAAFMQPRPLRGLPAQPLDLARPRAGVRDIRQVDNRMGAIHRATQPVEQSPIGQTDHQNVRFLDDFVEVRAD